MAQSPNLPAFQDPLEEMLTHALIQVTPPRKKGKGAPTISDFKGPAQWYRKRCVALWHAESNSLLGNFAEYRHVKDHTARWLQREEGLTAVDVVESVSGPQWVEWADPASERLHRFMKEVETIIDVILPALGVRAPAVPVLVILSGVGIHRVELMDVTTFHSSDRNTALTLPQHLNILSEMHQEGKVALKEEMEKESSDEQA